MSRRVSLVAHALAGWVVCGSTIALGRQLLSMQSTLVVHALAAPLAFGLLTWHYFRHVADAPPFKTAAVLTGVVIGLDLFVVAPFFEHSYAMFRSMLGTWVPFASILATSYVVGRALGRKGTETGGARQSRKR